MPPKERSMETTDNGTSEKTEQKSEILDSFLNQIEEPKKGWLNNVLGNNENLKKGFEDFWKYASKIPTNLIQIKKELSKCENPDDIKNFIDTHQGYKIGIGVSEIHKREDLILEEKRLIAERDKANAERDTANAERDTANAERDTANAERDKANAERDKANAERDTANAEREKLISDALFKRKELIIKHPDQEKAKKLDEDTRKEAKRLKNNLPEGTKKQLEEKGYDDDFINNYILLRVTLNKVKNDSSFDRDQVAQFEKSVNKLSSMDIFLKNIDNACKIADTRLSSFSSENIAQTRTELFNDAVGNQSLIKVRDHNKDNRDYSEIFHEVGDEELIKDYGKLLKGISKDFLNKYQTDPNFKSLTDNARKVKNNPDATNQDKQLGTLYDNMIKELSSKKIEVEEKTKDMMEEMCLITQVNSMAKCIGQESFSLNKANDIKYDESGAMVLDGQIDGADFSVRHNFNEARAPLQTSSKLIESADGNALEFGNNGKQKFKNSPFKLPGQENVFGMVSDIVASTKFSGDRFDSVDDYIDSMQKGIVGRMDEVFDKDAEVANEYMQNEVKGEKIVDGSLGLIQHIKPSIDLTRVINKESKMFDFMKILNYNIENSTPEEKNKLDWSINEIRKITDNYKSNEKSSGLYSESVSKYLENDKWLDTSSEKEGTDTKQNEIRIVDENINLEKQDLRLGLIFDMFIDFNKNPIDRSREGKEGNYETPLNMIVNDLYIQLHDKPKETKEQLERNEISDREQETADNVLNLEDSSLRPPESTVSMA